MTFATFHESLVVTIDRFRAVCGGNNNTHTNAGKINICEQRHTWVP